MVPGKPGMKKGLMVGSFRVDSEIDDCSMAVECQALCCGDNYDLELDVSGHGLALMCRHDRSAGVVGNTF
jgi:hypothetical protein